MTKHKLYISLSKLASRTAVLFIILYFSIANAEIKIAVIDTDQVISKSKMYQSMKNKLDQQHAVYQQEISAYENEIIKLDKKIHNESNKLSEDNLSHLKQDLNKREIEIQRLIKKHRISLDEMRAQSFEQIRAKLDQVINNIAKNENYVIILPKSNTIYSIDSIDISDKILKDFNSNN